MLPRSVTPPGNPKAGASVGCGESAGSPSLGELCAGAVDHAVRALAEARRSGDSPALARRRSDLQRRGQCSQPRPGRRDRDPHPGSGVGISVLKDRLYCHRTSELTAAHFFQVPLGTTRRVSTGHATGPVASSLLPVSEPVYPPLHKPAGGRHQTAVPVRGEESRITDVHGKAVTQSGA